MADQRPDKSPPADRDSDRTRASTRAVPSADLRAASIRQWERTFESTTRGLSISDAVTGRIESVNQAFALMHGGCVEDFIGMMSLSLVSPEWRQQSPEFAEQVNRHGHISRELDHIRRDGTRFTVRAEAITIRDSHEQPQLRIAWYQNLTEERPEDRLGWQAQKMFKDVFADAPSGIALIGLDQRFVLVNTALCVMLGRSAEELMGTPTIDVSHPDDYQKTREAYKNMSATTAPIAVEKRYLRPDGSTVWASCVGIVLRDAGGVPLNIVTHFQDVTERMLAEQSQAETYLRFESAFADAPVGIGLVGLDSHWLRVNQALCELTGYLESQLLKLSFRDITHPDDLSADLQQVDRLLGGEIDRYTMEQRYLRADGDELWISLAVSLVRDVHGNPLHFIRQSEDISERRREHESVQHLADHDSLTKLWNRRRFREELERQVSRCQRHGESAALILIDLNNFKAVNDTYGHNAGDDLLQHVASAMEKRLRFSDSLARLGGDEFGVLLANVGEDETTNLIGVLREIVRNSTVDAAGTEVGVTASVGFVMLGGSTVSVVDALGEADAAMYLNKAALKGVTARSVI